MVVQIIILGIYIAILLGIAVFSRRKAKTVNDFFLGGRKMGAWMTAFAYGTTYFSAVIFMGYAGKFGWNMGVSVTWVGIANALIGSFVVWKLMARPTREITQRLDASTMPDFFKKRYQSPNMKIVAALLIFIFLVPYCASVYQGLGLFFESVFHISYTYCMVVMAVLTAVYLLAGGYIATAMADFFQGLVMIVGVILMVGFVLGNEAVGGLSAGLEKLSQIPEAGSALSSPFGSASNVIGLISIILLTSLGTWGLPQMVHKFYAIRDAKAIKRGTIISTIFALIIGGSAYFVGGFGRLFASGFSAETTQAIADKNLDVVMPAVLNQALPPWMLGLILVLLLAASMSTLSSLVLVSSSSISMDLIKGSIKPQMSEKSTMAWMRSLCALFVLVSLILALFKVDAISTLMSYSWGALSGCFLAPFLLGVRWKGMTRAGAWAGIITGLTVVVPLMVLGAVGGILPAWMSPLAIGSMAMLISLIVTPIVSVITRKFDANHIISVFGEAKVKAVSKGESAQA
jgi:solute:Na+ symporter, SSS family